MISTIECYSDVTKEWYKVRKRCAVIFDKYFIDESGIEHPIEGLEKISDIPSYGEEYEMACWLSKNIGCDIHLVPRIETAKGSNVVSSVKTPDFLIKNEKWDLKTPRIGGKNIICRYLKKKNQKMQARNIIIDVTRLNESNKYILKLVEEQLANTQRWWVERIIIFRNSKIIRVYKKI